MKNVAGKNKKHEKNIYTATGVGVLIKYFIGELKVLSEKQQRINDKLDLLLLRMQAARNTEEIGS